MRLDPVLLLGGTAEAKQIYEALKTRQCRVIQSQSGLTCASYQADHVGGFGGQEGLKHFITTRSIQTVIDATHPYAVKMSQHAVYACKVLKKPLYRIYRPPWHAQQNDRWVIVKTEHDARDILKQDLSTPTLITLGARHASTFQCLNAPFFFRTIDPCVQIEPMINIVGRGPFTIDQERALFDTHTIQRLVCKNSGGPWSWPKLAIAREKGILVIMITRPSNPVLDTTYGSQILLEAMLKRINGSDFV